MLTVHKKSQHTDTDLSFILQESNQVQRETTSKACKLLKLHMVPVWDPKGRDSWTPYVEHVQKSNTQKGTLLSP